MTLAVLMIHGTFANETSTTSFWTETTWQVLGYLTIIFEVVGQFSYYYFRKGAYRYAAYVRAHPELFVPEGSEL